MITIGAGTMFMVHWLVYGLTDMLFGLGAMVVGIGLALLPDWRSAWTDAGAKPEKAE
jgi:hypothetical protein